jgi:hypothetical protein
MTTTITPPPAATVDGLRRLVTGTPPFLSVYLAARPGTETAPDEVAISWRQLRRSLADQGADETQLAAVDAVVEGHPQAPGLAVVVDGEGDGFHRWLPEEVPEMGQVGPLPTLGPLVDAWGRLLPHVIVVADRTGADLYAVAAPGVDDDDGEPKPPVVSPADADTSADPTDDVPEATGAGDAAEAPESTTGAEIDLVIDPGADVTTGEVHGDDDVIRKVKPGGWSQRRYQQRAENTWDANASLVAAEVAESARSVGARVIVAAGDSRAVTLLAEHLPSDVADLLTTADHGGRAAGADQELLAEEVQRAVATVAARDTVTSLEHFAEVRGRGAAVADGPEQTFEALRRGLVDTLLLHDAVDDDRTAWFDPSAPTAVALEPGLLRDLGMEPVEARMMDVAVWSALSSGGSVRHVPAHASTSPSGGLGATVRGPLN